MSKLKSEKHPENNVNFYIIAVVFIPAYLFVNSYISNTMAGPAVNFQKSIYDFSVDLYEVSCCFWLFISSSYAAECTLFMHIMFGK